MHKTKNRKNSFLRRSRSPKNKLQRKASNIRRNIELPSTRKILQGIWVVKEYSVLSGVAVEQVFISGKGKKCV